jgi:polysaccharide pyruvyl transferase WcaK-like protein
MTRRHFLATTLTAALAGRTRGAARGRPPRILLRSSWQVVNIGDIAHTPGVLALIERHLPGAEVVLWASADLSNDVQAMEHRRFPKLRIVKGTLDHDGHASNRDLGEAVAWADLLLHGSGPSLVAAADVASFSKHTGKPFGVYGITHGSYFSGDDRDLLTRARFVFFRDSVSLALAKAEGVASPVMAFGPDGAFACDLRNDDMARAFMRDAGLEDGKFVCCIPRLRFTPYWTIHGRETTQEQRARHARNEAMAEHDNAPLCQAVTALARETPLKVLVCPEDMSQMAVGKRWIIDRLPADVRARVVWRERFWLTDEALSTYVRSAGLFGLEMHSPIMCVGNGVPAIVCRFAEQTSKGIMWRDIGLGDWLLDFDVESDLPRLAPLVLDMVTNRAAALSKVAKARAFVEERQRQTMTTVERSLPAGP